MVEVVKINNNPEYNLFHNCSSCMVSDKEKNLYSISVCNDNNKSSTGQFIILCEDCANKLQLLLVKNITLT